MRYRGGGNVLRMTALTDDHHFMTQGDGGIDRLGEKELILMIQQLPPVYRMVFNLYVFEGLKHREIAGLLGITEGTSKSNLSDARTILKKALTVNYKAAK
jgi:DNA-directed RNA polymerase specialized sigma24 family protein